MIKSRLKEAAIAVSYRTGVTRRAIRLGDFFEFSRSSCFVNVTQRANQKFLILIYHRVSDSGNPFMIEKIPPPLFDLQMEYLAKHFNVLRMEEIIDHLQSGKSLPKRCVAITFDDGYKDNYRNAFPVLRKYNLPATIFLTGGCIDTGKSLWFDSVLYAFEHTSRNSLCLSGGNVHFVFNTPLERSEAAFQMLYRLKAYPPSARWREIEAIFSELRLKIPKDMDNQLLDWCEVKEMADLNISFGSHTMTHEILTTIKLEEAERELTESKKLIESQIHRRVRVFAYPNGGRSDYSAEVIDLIRKSGYEAAVTTIPGSNSGQQDPFQLKRIRPWRYDVGSFAAIMGYYYLRSSQEL